VSASNLRARFPPTVTKFRSLGSLLWKCFVRVWRTAPDPKWCFARGSIRRCRRPAQYVGNAIGVVSTEAVRTSKLLACGHG
jgi:hypothetical protein